MKLRKMPQCNPTARANRCLELQIVHFAVSLDLARARVQALVLTPTRELALQVAEAIHTYARRLGPVRVLPVYGGQSMDRQLQRLRGGVHVVVGTPGRVMDHLRRGTLTLDAIRTVVLDEADEMLRMGFIEDVEWILGRMPAERQTARKPSWTASRARSGSPSTRAASR